MNASRGAIHAWVLLAACSSQADSLLTVRPGSGAPVEFATDLWPGEGIPVIETRRPQLPLRSEPDPGARVVDTLETRVGQRVAFDSTRYQTIEAGSISVLERSQVTGRDLGEISHVSLDEYYAPARTEISVPVDAPATIDLLQYRAEGTCFVRLGERVIDAQPCPGFGRESIKVVREPVTRWWIRVRGKGGAFGWLLVSDSTARSVRREF